VQEGKSKLQRGFAAAEVFATGWLRTGNVANRWQGRQTTGAQLRDLTLCGLEAAQGHEFVWAWGKWPQGANLELNP